MADRSTKQSSILQTVTSMATTQPRHHSALQWPLASSGDTGSEKQIDLGDVTYQGHQHEDYVLVGLLHTVGLVLALVGNFSVIVIIARTKKLHTPSSLMVLVLATSDLLLSLFWNLVPFLLTFDDGVNRMLLQSRVACNVIGFAWQTLLTISTLSHSILAVDRYLFIVHPMKYQVYVTIRATSILTSVIVVIACLLSALTLITKSEFQYLQVAGMCIGSPIWSLLYLFLIFIPSLTVALFAYQRIWRLCVSIFKQEDTNASRGHSPRVSFSNHLPSLPSSRNQSGSDLSAMVELGDLKMPTEDMKPELQQQRRTADKEHKKATEKHIVTTVTTQHTTKVTRMNTTKMTTIASGPCEPSIPVEDPQLHQDDLHNTKTIDRKISEITEVEVEVQETTSTSKKRKRTKNVTIHTNSQAENLSVGGEQIGSDETCVRAMTPQSIHKTPVLKYTQVKVLKRNRTFSSIPFMSIKQQQQQRLKSQNPFIVTTPADSFTGISTNNNPTTSSTNLGPLPTSTAIKNSSHLTIIEPLPTLIATLPQRTNYETISKKLFGSQAILPSLLYVGILMPLSMQPVTSNYRHRRLRACLLIGLPVLIMAVSFIPFPGSLVYLGYLRTEQTMVGNGVGMLFIKLICHMTYAMVPSLTSLLLCLNNKPYRRALRQTMRCKCL